MTVEADAELIQALVAFTGHRPAQIARNIGVANTTINRHFRGTATTRLSAGTLEALRHAYPSFPPFAASGDAGGSVAATRLECLKLAVALGAGPDDVMQLADRLLGFVTATER